MLCFFDLITNLVFRIRISYFHLIFIWNPLFIWSSTTSKVYSANFIGFPFCSLHRLHDQDLAPRNLALLKKGLSQYFCSSSFIRSRNLSAGKRHNSSSVSRIDDSDSARLKFFVLPYQRNDNSPKAHYESYDTLLWRIRDQVNIFLSYSFYFNVCTQCVLLNIIVFCKINLKFTWTLKHLSFYMPDFIHG